MVGDLEYPHRQACLPRQGKSHPDTTRSLQSCIFIVQESGEGIVRLPEHPLIQDSLTCKNKLDVLYFVCCKFYVAATGLSKNQSYIRIKTTTIVCQIDSVLTFTRTGLSHTRFN